jgi:hypothetical protein
LSSQSNAKLQKSRENCSQDKHVGARFSENNTPTFATEFFERQRGAFRPTSCNLIIFSTNNTECETKMKICIELDEEMQERWDDAKDNLKNTIRKFHGDTIALTNSDVLKGILREWGPIYYMSMFSSKEIEDIKRSNPQNNS